MKVSICCDFFFSDFDFVSLDAQIIFYAAMTFLKCCHDVTNYCNDVKMFPQRHKILPQRHTFCRDVTNVFMTSPIATAFLCQCCRIDEKL